MKYLSQKLQDDSEKEGSFNPDWIVNNLLCVQHTNALSVQYFILKSSVCSEKVLTLTNILWNIAPNMQVELGASPLLTIDEVQKVQPQRIASFIAHVFQMTYAALVDKLIQQEELNHCYGCAIQHPSQN